MRNEITAIAYRRTREGIVFDLTLEPLESALIVFRRDKRDRPMRIAEGGTPSRTIPVVRRKAKTQAAAKPEGKWIELDGCSWVWYPEGEPAVSAPPGTVCFRRLLALPTDAKIRSARFVVTADNRFELFVNGKSVGKSVGGDAWRNPLTLDLTGHLRPGVNVLAIAAENQSDRPNPAGLIGRYVIELGDGVSVRGCIDRTWKASKAESEGWLGRDFDDSGWLAAREIARFGDPPWGYLQGTWSPVKADPFFGVCTLPEGLDLAKYRAYLEMDGLTESSASVRVNGTHAGGIIGRPFRVNIGQRLRAGVNQIEIEPCAPRTAHIALYEK